MPSTNPHDAYFRSVFSAPARFAGLIRACLPPGALEALDLSALQFESQRYVEESLRDFEADLVARVPLRSPWANDEAPYLCVLLEHQRTPDVFMALRLLVSCARIWEQHRKANPSSRALPPIVPIVVYHGPPGQPAWPAPRTLHELMPVLELVPELAPWVPNLSMCLDELCLRSYSELDARALDEQGRVALLALKHSRGRDIDERATGWSARVRADDATRPRDLRGLIQLLHYVVSAAPHLQEQTMQNIIHTLPLPEQAEEGKTLAVRWMERGEALGEALGEARGEARGRALGERQVLRRLLAHRFGTLPAEVDARLEAADVEAMERWAERLLDAPTLDDVFN